MRYQTKLHSNRRRRLVRRPPPPPEKPAGNLESLPVLPLRQVVLFPYTMTSLIVDHPRSKRLVEEVATKNRLIALVPVTRKEAEPETREDFFAWGCVGRIVKVLRFPDETLRLLVRGIRRVEMRSLTQTDPYYKGSFRRVAKVLAKDPQLDALARQVTTTFQELIALAPNLPEELKVALLNIDDYDRLADLIANTITISYEEKLEMLRTADLRHRLEMMAVLLNREMETLKVGSEIQSKVSSTFSKQQREAFLREQLRVIQEQLGEEPETPELAELRKKVEAAGMPAEAKEAALRELDRLRRMYPAAADYQVARNYLDWLLAMPWQTVSPDRLDLFQARALLDHDHYGLEKVKDRILEFLAVLKLKPDTKSPIICFAGPPGVGKTSLGQSIARALDRQFVRVSLGGIHDEAEIRGHRRTYVGSLPGRIIQGIRRAKTANPVFMLDEIDKIGADFRGDPAAALLEALDPAQNHQFSDHYLEVPFDLSRVLFITTANLTDPIPSALRDRMEILQLPGYSHQEKVEIARRFLIPRQLELCGLKELRIRFHPAALDRMISVYTFEAGVRNLERAIGQVGRKIARRIAENPEAAKCPIPIKAGQIQDYLGPQKLFPETAVNKPMIGLATGLAWTAAGGDVLQIEVTSYPGKGQLQLTGSLGDVMKESAQTAFSFVRTHHRQFGFDPAVLEKTDIHVHVPAGATPKDGPSAGITIATALTSLLTGIPVKAGLAMTGEISLRGRILPVGGIKEKVLAAFRSRVKTVLLPEKNRHDLDEIAPDVRRQLEFVFCDHALKAVQSALHRPAAGK